MRVKDRQIDKTGGTDSQGAPIKNATKVELESTSNVAIELQANADGDLTFILKNKTTGAIITDESIVVSSDGSTAGTLSSSQTGTGITGLTGSKLVQSVNFEGFTGSYDEETKALNLIAGSGGGALIDDPAPTLGADLDLGVRVYSVILDKTDTPSSSVTFQTVTEGDFIFQDTSVIQAVNKTPTLGVGVKVIYDVEEYRMLHITKVGSSITDHWFVIYDDGNVSTGLKCSGAQQTLVINSGTTVEYRILWMKQNLIDDNSAAFQSEGSFGINSLSVLHASNFIVKNLSLVSADKSIELTPSGLESSDSFSINKFNFIPEPYYTRILSNYDSDDLVNTESYVSLWEKTSDTLLERLRPESKYIGVTAQGSSTRIENLNFSGFTVGTSIDGEGITTLNVTSSGSSGLLLGSSNTLTGSLGLGFTAVTGGKVGLSTSGAGTGFLASVTGDGKGFEADGTSGGSNTGAFLHHNYYGLKTENNDVGVFIDSNNIEQLVMEPKTFADVATAKAAIVTTGSFFYGSVGPTTGLYFRDSADLYLVSANIVV